MLVTEMFDNIDRSESTGLIDLLARFRKDQTISQFFPLAIFEPCPKYRKYYIGGYISEDRSKKELQELQQKDLILICPETAIKYHAMYLSVWMCILEKLQSIHKAFKPELVKLIPRLVQFNEQKNRTYTPQLTYLQSNISFEYRQHHPG